VDFPNVRFPFDKLVARDSQLTIHQPLAASKKLSKNQNDEEYINNKWTP